MFQPEKSPTFQLAADFVQFSNRSVFLTGKAGTGKTTFLRYIKGESGKEAAIVAPTGVAAINAGGVTIHSFFQLPLEPFVPEARSWNGEDPGFNDRKSLLAKMRISSDRRKVFQSLELLVIDEISMVRADLLDEIDAVLRHFRFRPQEPFGGVQLLMIGDMYQLPPVVPDQDWRLLSAYYKTPYFFSSRALEENTPVYVAFDKIYRQKDESFIDLLNAVRENTIGPTHNAILESRYKPDFEPSPDEGYIILTSHNYQADAINAGELDKLTEDAVLLPAEISGDFSAKAFPADEQLVLKVGAQVMFLKNDTDKAKRYYNGKIGTVKEIDDEVVTIRCKGETADISLTRYKWSNIRYIANELTQVMEEQEIGSFIQFPLRLAWAITIHKSQGLTFEKAVIDAGKSFTHGQVYVALSRCTSLEGMVLKSRIGQSSMQTADQIRDFSQGQTADENLRTELEKSRRLYQQKVVLDLFDFAINERQIRGLQKNVTENVSSFTSQTQEWLSVLIDKLSTITATGLKFQHSLPKFFTVDAMPEETAALQERIMKASGYFGTQFQDLITHMENCRASTDNRALAKVFSKDAEEIHTRLCHRKFLIDQIITGFNLLQFQKAKSTFQKPGFEFAVYSGAKKKVFTEESGLHPELFAELRTWRNEKADTGNQPVYMVLPTSALKELVAWLPQNKHDLLQIPGFGKRKVDQYGDELLEMIQSYCKDHGIDPQPVLPTGGRIRKEAGNSKDKKPDSKLASFTLYKEGKTMAEIAELRGFAVSTIEGHLSQYIKTGELELTSFVDIGKRDSIVPFLENKASFGEIKNQLGESVSYGEIRMVANWWERSNGGSGESSG